MSLAQILILAALGVLARPLMRRRGRSAVLLAASVLALFALQPATPIRHLDFWLPTTSLGLALITWAATRPREEHALREPAITFGALACLVLLVALSRYLDPPFRLTPTRPPSLWDASLALAALAAGGALAHRFRGRRGLIGAASLFILALFLILKSEPLTTGAAAVLRSQTGQEIDLASPLDIRWLGFSYLAFRLLHTLRDRLAGRLPSLALHEFVTYVLFFPALAAGPIDRAERFAQDLRAPASSPLAEGGARILLGAFKKFVLADSLALISLGPEVARQAAPSSPLWHWVLLYAYAFRIYFDFGGYTDVAIGLGLLFGVRLPENFDRPYARTNLTAFWNSWHMTLAGWFRSYLFNPLTRALRSARRPLPQGLIILIGQLGTMLLIGLWHGITWNFAAWGAWHGIGLFIHNRWADLLRRRGARPPGNVAMAGLGAAAAAVLTFHFVALGWIWFALPSLSLATDFLLGLFAARP
jgi:D-alanyl-lipoteichoic acid acyltransferase DltB (MBOAT superfamily)